MALPGLGHKVLMAYKPETTYGTRATTPLQQLEVLSWDIMPTNGTIPDESLYDAVAARAVYQAGFTVRGTFRVRGNYTGIIELLRGATGGYTQALGTGGDITVRTHTFKAASALKSYTFEIDPGDLGTSGTNVNVVVGAKITSMVLRSTAGLGPDAMLTMEFTIIAKDYLVNVTPELTPAAPPPVKPIIFHQGPLVPINTIGDSSASVDVRLRSMEFSIENGLAEDRFYFGSKNIDEPVRNTRVITRFRLTHELNNIGIYNTIKNFTASAILVRFEDRSALLVGGGTKYPSLQLKCGTAYPMEVSTPFDDFGILVCTSTWEGAQDATDASPYKIDLDSLEAALPA